MITLSFFGGAKEVTGACYLLDTGATKLLIDCGLFQCPRFCERKNEEPFPFATDTLDALIITHAHIDHIGRVPKLARQYFRGKIYSTKPTKDFAAIMLADSLGVLEKEARDENRGAFYSEEDIAKALSVWEGVEYYHAFQVGDATITLRNAGHILGSALVEIEVPSHEGNIKIVFTGDLGNAPNPLIMPPDALADARHLIIESAYGNRAHEGSGERTQKFERVIEDTLTKGGVLMIPAFSLERTQELLFELNDFFENNRVPRVPVFIDSPLAIKATAIYRNYQRYFSKDARRILEVDDNLFNFPGLTLAQKTEESKAINEVPAPKIIIAGAGMMQGGRILHHAKRYVPDPKSTLLFIGYQAKGSMGRQLIEGAKEVHIMGERVAINATIKAIGGYSAHADADALYAFVEHSKSTLKNVFVVQGEEEAADALAQRIRDNFAINTYVPAFGEKAVLEA
ncbi:MAG: MBL fold metallo-hydrolase [Candidatus Sungbacteria bacterium]|nr:MBL fold metallo-hydrolase [Candidatus Sungbacteria bacterium]